MFEAVQRKHDSRTVAEATDVVATNPEKFGGPNAGSEFPRIEIRDYAASQLSYLLGLGIWAKKEWTPGTWEDLRARVKDALKR